MGTSASASGSKARQGWVWIAAAGLVTAPGMALALGAFGASTPTRALVYGVAILGAAFLLSWVAEAVQIDAQRREHGGARAIVHPDALPQRSRAATPLVLLEGGRVSPHSDNSAAHPLAGH